MRLRAGFFAALFLALFSALLVVLAHAPAARAHASLVKAEPPDGTVIPSPPPALKLTFNEPVSPLVIRLIGPSGEPIALREVEAENATIVIPAPPGLAAGTHVLSWRVISADGHPVGGAVMFSIGASSAQPPAATQTVADPAIRAGIWSMKVIIYLGLFVGVGGAFFWAWLAERSAGAAAPWTVGMLAAALIAVAVSVGLQGLDALDLPLSGLRQKTAWQAGLATAYGFTAITALFALFAGLFSLSATSPRVVRGLSLAGLLGVGLALAFSGHASTAEPRLVSRAALFLHCVCIAFWIGSLLPLYASIRAHPARRPRARAVLARDSAPARGRAAERRLARRRSTRACRRAVDHELWPGARVQACGRRSLVGLGRGQSLLAGAETCRPGCGQRSAVRRVARPGARARARHSGVGGALALHAAAARARRCSPDLDPHPWREGDGRDRDRAERPRSALIAVLDGTFRPLAVKELALVLANPGAGVEPMRRSATAPERTTGESISSDTDRGPMGSAGRAADQRFR